VEWQKAEVRENRTNLKKKKWEVKERRNKAVFRFNKQL